MALDKRTFFLNQIISISPQQTMAQEIYGMIT